jgi:hypothetical protein
LASCIQSSQIPPLTSSKGKAFPVLGRRAEFYAKNAAYAEGARHDARRFPALTVLSRRRPFHEKKYVTAPGVGLGLGEKVGSVSLLSPFKYQAAEQA